MHKIMNTEQTVKYIAALAHLKFGPEDLKKFSAQFKRIVDYMAVIEKLDLDGVEPLAQVIDSENVLREDVVRPSLRLDEALKNAPKKNENFFKVPKVLDLEPDAG